MQQPFQNLGFVYNLRHVDHRTKQLGAPIIALLKLSGVH